MGLDPSQYFCFRLRKKGYDFCCSRRVIIGVERRGSSAQKSQLLIFVCDNFSLSSTCSSSMFITVTFVNYYYRDLTNAVLSL